MQLSLDISSPALDIDAVIDRGREDLILLARRGAMTMSAAGAGLDALFFVV